MRDTTTAVVGKYGHQNHLQFSTPDEDWITDLKVTDYNAEENVLTLADESSDPQVRCYILPFLQKRLAELCCFSRLFACESNRVEEGPNSSRNQKPCIRFDPIFPHLTRR